MFVPGSPPTEAAWNQALRANQFSIASGLLLGTGLTMPPQATFLAQNGEFRNAFPHRTISEDVRAKLEAAPGALVLRWPIDLLVGRAQMVSVVAALRDAGAIAVRLEQSKLGWDVDRWIELFSSENPSDWHLGSIFMLSGEKVMQSCGMHLFSMPDVQVPLKGATAKSRTVAQALNFYQLSEDPMLRSGQSFAPDAATQRRVIERWPDTSYPTDHPSHNRYGVWHLGSPGSKPRPLGALELTFVPTLYAVLIAAERKAAGPLTRKQVLAIRDNGTCIAISPREAQSIERDRGYADLNPEFVWEQWQMVSRYNSG